MTIFSRPERERDRRKILNNQIFFSPPVPPHLINDWIKVWFIAPNFLIHKQRRGIKSLLIQLCSCSARFHLRVGTDTAEQKSLFLSHLIYFQEDRKKKLNGSQRGKSLDTAIYYAGVSEGPMSKSQMSFMFYADCIN